jgi:perosamine synthetase
MAALAELTQRKREIFSYYREHLTGLTGVSINPEPSDTVNGAWMPTVVFSPTTGITREILQTAFAAENIDARVFFHSLSCLPMFEKNQVNPRALDIPTRAINFTT